MCGLGLKANWSKISAQSTQHDRLPWYKWERTTVRAGTGDNPGGERTKKRQTGINIACSISQDQSDGKRLRTDTYFLNLHLQSDNSQETGAPKWPICSTPLMRKKSSKFYWFSFPPKQLSNIGRTHWRLTFVNIVKSLSLRTSPLSSRFLSAPDALKQHLRALHNWKVTSLFLIAGTRLL